MNSSFKEKINGRISFLTFLLAGTLISCIEKTPPKNNLHAYCEKHYRQKFSGYSDSELKLIKNDFRFAWELAVIKNDPILSCSLMKLNKFPKIYRLKVDSCMRNLNGYDPRKNFGGFYDAKGIMVFGVLPLFAVMDGGVIDQTCLRKGFEAKSFMASSYSLIAQVIGAKRYDMAKALTHVYSEQFYVGQLGIGMYHVLAGFPANVNVDWHKERDEENGLIVGIYRNLKRSKNDVSRKNLLGQSPLHTSALTGYKNLSMAFIEDGLSPFEKDKLGLSPIDYSVIRGESDFVCQIVKKVCSENKKCKIDPTLYGYKSSIMKKGLRACENYIQFIIPNKRKTFNIQLHNAGSKEWFSKPQKLPNSK